MLGSAVPGLELISAAVLLVNDDLVVEYANPAAENTFELSSSAILANSLERIFRNCQSLKGAIRYARENHCGYTEHDLALEVASGTYYMSCTVTPIDAQGTGYLLMEFRPIAQQLKIAREERLRDQSEANRELIRNLAHEIRNPLGGIRGAAQLLDKELPRSELKEYTDVIIKEADRLKSLLDRLLTPYRLPVNVEINIHEVLEQVRILMMAEDPGGATFVRDYDTSLPPFIGDREQIIQAVLNVVRNAAQAVEGKGTITLRTRVARQKTLGKKRYRHALMAQIIDTGPGIPEAIREKIFNPLVSGREGGSGIGLTLAQAFINQHNGTIECESSPGHTCFTLVLPLPDNEIEIATPPKNYAAN